MNWDAIGALAELAGAVGVISSLAYLAVQIRQNTRQMEISARASRGAAYQDVLSTLQAYLLPVGLDGELADIVRRGLEDASELNESEYFRFNWILGGHVTNLDNVFYQYQHGVVSEDRWQTMQCNAKWFLSAPGFRFFWRRFDTTAVTAEFAAFIQAELDALQGSAADAVEQAKVN